MKNRNLLVDALRGVAVLCVVLGHAIQRGMIVGYENNWLFVFICTFHMPLFILLSGYTLYLSSKKFDRYFLIEKTRRLLYPTIVWSYLIYFFRDLPFVGIKPFIAFPDSIIEYTKDLILHPNYIIWFLYVLFIYNLIFYIGKKLPNKFFISYLLSMGVILFSISIDLFGINQIRQYYPFFILGYYLPVLKPWISKYRKLWIPAIIFFAVNILSWSLSYVGEVKYYIMSISSVTIIYYLVKLIPFNKFYVAIGTLGRYSMQIYLTQCLFLNIGFGFGKIRTISIFFFALLLSFIATYITTKISFVRVALYGK